MRNLIANIILMTGATCMSGIALHAETYQGKATVPFAFELHGKTLPAGNYTIEQDSNQIPILRNVAARTSIVIRYAGVEKGKACQCLVFHRYGNRYFLAEVWSPSKTGTLLKPGAAERELMHSGAPRQEAVISTETDPTRAEAQ